MAIPNGSKHILPIPQRFKAYPANTPTVQSISCQWPPRRAGPGARPHAHPRALLACARPTLRTGNLAAARCCSGCCSRGAVGRPRRFAAAAGDAAG
eukprot:207333-Chlamydomonas_euryale.AAC.1